MLPHDVVSKTPDLYKVFLAQSDTYRWDAISRRDQAVDRTFVYCVSTTGIYCRSTCPARLPKREHVTFQPTCEAAERAGFRPCKRCSPRDPSQAQRYATAIAYTCRLIESADKMPTLATLAQAVGFSNFHFHRIFKSATGVTPKAYAVASRSRRMKQALQVATTVTNALYTVGYQSSSRFYENAPARLGMTPTVWRKGGDGVEIRFAIGTCSLGCILVAMTARGVCAIHLGDTADDVLLELQNRFPKATLIGGDKNFETVVTQVIAFVEAPQLGLDLPLDVRGTAFQERVWQALQRIPSGTTATYAAIAAAVGTPKAIRAVAGACAANPVAIAVPCHRVVRSDGALSGYRWGIERKRKLLETEKALEKEKRS